MDRRTTYVPNSAFSYLSRDLYMPSSNTKEQILSLKELTKSYNENEYIDVHSWIVTPKSFEIMIHELNELGYIDLVVDQLYTFPRSVEFLVQLKKGRIKSDDSYKRKELYIQRKVEQLEEFEDAIEIKHLLNKVKPQTRIYIYGIGAGVTRILNILQGIEIDYDAHVVSDGYKTENECNGHPVVELSEISELDDIVVLIGVEKYKDDIIPKLEELKINYFFD